MICDVYILCTCIYIMFKSSTSGPGGTTLKVKDMTNTY